MLSRLRRLFSRPAPVEFRDPELGILVLDCGVWIGSVPLERRRLRFVVAGTETEPYPGLLIRARALRAGFSGVERVAMEFLRSREKEVSESRLEVYAFECLWEERPEDFALEFLADGDDARIWRVEFVAGRPSQTGFDD